MADKDALDQQLAIRLSEADMVRLDGLADRIPVATRNAIARAALRFGLDFLEEDPTRIVQQPPPKRGRKKRKP